MMGTLKVKHVIATDTGYSLLINWADGSRSTVDLAQAIDSLDVFALLRDLESV